MGNVKEDWSVSGDLCDPVTMDQDRFDCEKALLKYRTTEELQDNLILIYLNMPDLGYPDGQLALIREWRTILCEELVRRKPIHCRPWLKARIDKKVDPCPNSVHSAAIEQETTNGQDCHSLHRDRSHSDQKPQHT
jgi:hypothetical protein